MWFCTIRTGMAGMTWFVAQNTGGRWADWRSAAFDPSYQVGELHITSDGQELYYHSDRPGGLGGYDIWVCRNENGVWGPPQNVTILNSPETDGWPFLTADGNEMWFTRTYLGSPAIFRSVRTAGGEWQAPELIISQFAGEASLDAAGNLYFTHPYYKDGVKLETDIYVAYRLE
jgi:hypothetical protein